MRERGRPLAAASAMLSLALTVAVALAVSLAGDPARAGNCLAPGCSIGEINAWSSEVVELIRGPVHIDFPEAGTASFGDPADIPGAASGVPTQAVSLGDGGSVTVRFADPIYDGPDFDLAVFENGISTGTAGLIFMELGFVEVSSDGVQFARFASLTSRLTPVAAFEEADPDDYDNLAGNRLAGTGTPFDLFELRSHPLVTSGDVDLDAIEYVRIKDVVGNGTTSDSMGHPIYDPFATPFISGGFDIDAVGAINVPEPGAQTCLSVGALGLAWIERRRARARARS